MFKKMCKAMLKEENYIETLAFIARKFDKCKTMYEAENLYDKIDSQLWAMACDTEDGTDMALLISSALRVAMDGMDLPFFG